TSAKLAKPETRPDSTLKSVGFRAHFLKLAAGFGLL
ncbi:hypothetical protein PENNAL_c0967G09137, partial [Penicillium nalgiovense]